MTLGDVGETLGETFFQEKEGFPQTPFEESRFAASGAQRARRVRREYEKET